MRANYSMPRFRMGFRRNFFLGGVRDAPPCRAAEKGVGIKKVTARDAVTSFIVVEV